MPALDTNVLVRWLVRDDETQFEAVRGVLAEARRRARPLWVPVTVLLELEWVLRSRYRVARDGIIEAFDLLLESRELGFDDEPAVERALWRFRRSPDVDFADCLHVELAARGGHAPLLTFDARAAAMAGARGVAP
ncbi:MAG TPA: type II toxin-antitoxin system VapC family toxin [Burkholderiaceae bacterium]|nr:type II toxin-antitoxin system VapC family toxin [Burkholderiaceae bacterium]